MSKEMNAATVVAGFFIGIGVLMLLALGIIYSVISAGVLIYCFWGWFLLPVFPALPHIGIMQAYGIAMAMGAIMPKNFVFTKVPGEETDMSKIIGAALSPWIVLLMGYLFKVICL